MDDYWTFNLILDSRACFQGCRRNYPHPFSSCLDCVFVQLLYEKKRQGTGISARDRREAKADFGLFFMLYKFEKILRLLMMLQSYLRQAEAPRSSVRTNPAKRRDPEFFLPDSYLSIGSDQGACAFVRNVVIQWKDSSLCEETILR
ncbi:hypothetical protein RKD52_003616 [Metabacillus sp. SLBN-84]